MGAAFSSIKPEQMATAGLRPVMRVQAVQDPPAKKGEKEKEKKEKKEEKDTTHQTVDELQNKFGF
jgi:transposase